MGHGLWQIRIDTGGTFTDAVGIDPQGAVHRCKVLSRGGLRGRVVGHGGGGRLRIEHQWSVTPGLLDGYAVSCVDVGAGNAGRVASFDPRTGVLAVDGLDVSKIEDGTTIEVTAGEPAPVLASRLLTRTPLDIALPNTELRIATTRGTNTLLERSGAPTALFITRGFGDLLEIGDQQRPDLFALQIVKRQVPCATVVEIDERLAADGRVLRPLDHGPVVDEARRVLASGIDVAAVALMHAYVNPAHESAVAALLREAGFAHVSTSADLAPLIKLLPRAETTVVDAYLAPVIGSYVESVRARIPGRIHLMTSAGGLIAADAFRPKDSLLSGPAGGVAGAAAAGRRSGFDRIIGFDMGGTSTDVARYDRDFTYEFQQTVGDVRLLSPALAIETVAAGGGSICRAAGDRIAVGPESAGARPGPACYGAGGPLTLTDVNLLAGRLASDRFAIPIAVDDAERRLDEVLEQIGPDADREATIDGFLEIADERMAAAIERVSLRQGEDPAAYAMVAFGGAGGQHACSVARRLGISCVLMPRDAALLSAVGLGEAVVERFAQRQVLRSLDDVEGQLPGWFDALAETAVGEVAAEGVERESIVVRRRQLALRLSGQDAVIDVAYGDRSGVRAAFGERYRVMYGHAPLDRPIEVESIRVVASSERSEADTPTEVETRAVTPAGPRRPARFDGQWVDAPVFDRAELPAGSVVVGPALVLETLSAFVVEPGWTATIDEHGALVATSGGDRDDRTDRRRPAVVDRELFTHRFGAIARDMGQVLERAALSTNVKERLDFSCTLLDARGRLIVNAPHMPVHLGAMGLCVRALAERVSMDPGDVVVTNHPACGGSHLPDITVVTPVHVDDGTLVGYVACRAHHAELGGSRPGSMPPAATCLAEEGVLIPPVRVVRRGDANYGDIERMLRGGPWPSRAVDENLADLRAQVAANNRGAAALTGLAQRYGVDEVARQMRSLESRAEHMTRAALLRLAPGTYDAVERLDDGAEIRVRIDVADGLARVDFAGSAGTHPGNLNATPAIVRSAVMYAFRLLIGDDGNDLPLNEGIMRVIDVRIPPGMLDPVFGDDPADCPAVVGGNVETSQRLVDTLLKALGLVACSQGTMNNTLFGSDRFGYYETVCGGSGAGPGFDGALAVHTHMTNTRITDPEILEHRYPVRLERFAIRHGSGGAGRHRGGDGVIRVYRFLAPVALSMLSQHRAEGPYGMDGGQPGRPGRQRVIRASGVSIDLEAIDACDLDAGDQLVLETPGGGGFGVAS